MPEGPSILFLKNKLQRFKGKTVSQASGSTEMDKSVINFIKILDIQTFGENLLFVFKDFFINVNLGLSGSMLVNKKKKADASFSLQFPHSEINFYAAETQLYKGKPEEYFNFKTDILNDNFDGEWVLNDLQENHAEEMIGDVLIKQEIFAGVGDIIRVESLYRAKIHPNSLVKDIPEKKLVFLIISIVNYAYEFLNLLKTDEVKEKALVYGKEKCPKDKTIVVVEELGKQNKKTFVCPKCQKLYE